MKRFFAILLLLIAFGLQAQAQVDYTFGNIKRSRKLKNIPSVGIKGGITSYTMHFSDKSYNGLSGERIQSPGYGAFIEFPISKKRGWALGLEFMMIERGVKKSFEHLGVQEVNQIKSQYIDFRIPVTYYFLISDYINPYLFGAADFSYCHGGTDEVTYPDGEYPDSKVDISQSDAVLTQYDLSLAAGVGVRFNIIFELFTLSIKFDASYNYGLMNVKSKVDGTPANLYAYHNDEANKEAWRNRGLEFMMSVAIPLKFNRMHDACWGWK